MGRARVTAILVALALQVGGLLLFARGFFPKQLVVSGHADVPLAFSGGSEPPFKKLAFVVVDALRSDFVYGNGSHFPYVQSLLEAGEGLPLTGHSTPPTVTMPRLKGLTTGATPNFLDAILNIAEDDTSSSLAAQDSWLWQMKNQGRRIHMFGDDTWIKLFPGMFDRTDGTSSFFVSDYTEVDNNVTRHLDNELATQDWDVLILHYLGLDHIGHKGGPSSPLMPAKQLEMDAVVRRVYEALDDDTLLVLLGDHGMTDGGNHGGSAEGETSAALTFLGRKLASLGHKYKLPAVPSSGELTFFSRVQQPDLVPTLAALFGFAVPKNSIGVMIRPLLELLPEKHQIFVLKQNVQQLVGVLERGYGPFDAAQDCTDAFQDGWDVHRFKCEYKRLDSLESVDALYELLYEMQGVLARSGSNYIESDMLGGTVAVGLALALSLGLWLTTPGIDRTLKFIIAFVAGSFCSLMFASSLVEEEHFFWYWGATGFLSWLYITTARHQFKVGVSWIVCLSILRIIRSWNRTGIQDPGGPPFVRFLTTDAWGPFLWFCVVMAYGSVGERIWRGTFRDLSPMAGFVFSFMIIMASMTFKINVAFFSMEYLPRFFHLAVLANADEPEKLISLARLSMFCVGVGVLYELSKLLTAERLSKFNLITNVSYLLEVLLLTQSRVYNIPLFILFNLLRNSLKDAISRYHRSAKEKAVILCLFVIVVQHFTFFAFGGSNSLATIDLSNAYNGASSYDIILVGVLTFVSNWVGPVYWSIAGLSLLMEDTTFYSLSRGTLLGLKTVITLVVFSGVALGILVSCWIQKHHLFIWTVFSPKLLYAGAWILFQQTGIDIVIAAILVALGR